MATLANACNFSGTSGSAWPNPSGGVLTETGWTFSTPVGAFSAGPTETVNGASQGKEDGTASSAAFRIALECQTVVANFNLLSSNYTGFEIDAILTRSAVSATAGTQDIEGGIVLCSTAITGSPSFYLFRTFEASSGGKSPSQEYGVQISKVISGTETNLANTQSTTFFSDSAAKAISMKFRAFPLATAQTLLQAKAWDATAVSEPAWPDVRTAILNSANGSVNGTSAIVLQVLDNTAALQTYNGTGGGVNTGANTNGGWGLYTSWPTTGTDFNNLWGSYNEYLLQPSDGPDFWHPGQDHYRHQNRGPIWMRQRTNRSRIVFPAVVPSKQNSQFFPFFG